MTTDGHRDPQQDVAIIKFVGLPNQLGKPNESTRWRRFLQFLRPWAKKTGWVAQYGAEFGQAFAEAELAKRQGEAQKLAMEAANIAAERDHKEHQTVKAVNEEIARIFSQDDQPELARKLQLANLIAANPQIAKQLEIIEAFYVGLQCRYGTSVELIGENQRIEHQVERESEKLE
jgi:hypothetical protein